MTSINPLTGHTPNYGLPYPEGDDAPYGAAQMKALATGIDSGLTKVKTQPNSPWAQLDWLDNQPVAAGATAYPNFALTVQSSHNLFRLIDSTDVTTSRTGAYYIYWNMRMLRSAGATAVGGFITLTMMMPKGVTLFDSARPSYNANWLDNPGQGVIRWNANGSVAWQVNNQSGATFDVKAGRIWLVWLGD